MAVWAMLGLVAAGIHPNPVPYADFVTSTTQKTLRGPRGGLILCKGQHAKAIDRAVALDSTLPEAFASRGSLFQSGWRWAEAERDYQRALALSEDQESKDAAEQ